jgi:hypothetical protein
MRINIFNLQLLINQSTEANKMWAKGQTMVETILHGKLTIEQFKQQ